MLPTISEQDFARRILRNLDVRFQHDESHDPLHLVWIRHTDHTAHVHQLVRVEYVFDLRRIDIIAAGDDHALDPLAEVDETVRVHHAKVSGMQPFQPIRMPAQSVRRFLRIVDVFHHHRRTGQADLAFLAVRHFLFSTRFDDLIEGIRERQSDAAFFRPVRRCQTARGHALRRAITLSDRNRRVVLREKFVETFF